MPRRSSPPISEKKILTMDRHIPMNPMNPQKPSFLQTMKEGIAFGAGSSIGHRFIDMMSPSQKSSSTDKKLEEYQQCMKKYDDTAVCERIIN